MLRLLTSLALLCLCHCAPPAGDVRAGRQVFVDTCATCHGDDGLGLEGNSPTATAPNLRARIQEISDRAIERAVVDGVGEMAPVALTDDELDDVMAYVRNGWQ